jgi:acetylornithine deacetylase/succinyl-diaminopimelate desuccinylase-like protein
MASTTEKIDEYLRANLDTYIEQVARLCAQPSVSSTGEGVEKCASLVCELLGEHAVECEMFSTPGNPIIVGKIPGKSDRTLLFYNHYDVQPPEPLELWHSPAFEPVIRDGAIYARGTKDDKGEFISRLAAMQAVLYAQGEMPCNLIFLLEGEEENGSPHIAAFVRRHLHLLRAHGSIWEEGSVEVGDQPSLLLGVRGVLYIEMSVDTMKIDAHSGYAHALPNAAWRLHHALCGLKDREENILIPGFYEAVESPSEKVLELFDQWPDVEPVWQEQFGVRHFLHDARGVDLRRNVFKPTCNIAGFGSGYQGLGTKTVIPARALAKVDFRLVPRQDPEDILVKLRAHLDQQGFEDIQVKVLGKMWPFTTPVGDPLVDLAVRTGQEVYGKSTLIGPISGGSSPIYAVAGPLGIPVINPGVGYWDNHTHAPNEHIRLRDFLNGSRQIARIISGFADLP